MSDGPAPGALHVRPTGSFGVYIHFPWCARRCPYCDFAVAVQHTIPHEAYADAVLRELEREAPRWRDRTLRTVYFGGGTPGLWEPRQLVRVLDAVRHAFGGEPDEVTVEVNPEHADADAWRRLADGGVHRISLGCQSFDEAVLGTLGRQHTPDQALRAVDLAHRAGIERLSVDLIYGAPSASFATVDRDLAALARLRPLARHVSAYELTWEPGTGLWSRRARGRVASVSEDAVVDQGERLARGLRALGYERYEVSNWAVAGHESRHNAGYWRGDEYLGLGVGAHGMRVEAGGAVRTANPRAVRDYLRGDGPTREPVRAPEHLAECLMTAMRTRDGVDLDALLSRAGADAGWRRRVEGLVAEWEARGWVVRHGTRRAPTEEGLRWADSFAEQAWERLVE